MKPFDLRHNWRYTPEGQWTCECLLTYPTPRDGFCANKITRLREALAPVVAVADAYEWVAADGTQPPDECELVSTPDGGRTLLTVADALSIRAALRGVSS